MLLNKETHIAQHGGDAVAAGYEEAIESPPVENRDPSTGQVSYSFDLSKMSNESLKETEEKEKNKSKSLLTPQASPLSEETKVKLGIEDGSFEKPFKGVPPTTKAATDGSYYYNPGVDQLYYFNKGKYQKVSKESGVTKKEEKEDKSKFIYKGEVIDNKEINKLEQIINKPKTNFKINNEEVSEEDLLSLENGKVPSKYFLVGVHSPDYQKQVIASYNKWKKDNYGGKSPEKIEAFKKFRDERAEAFVAGKEDRPEYKYNDFVSKEENEILEIQHKLNNWGGLDKKERDILNSQLGVVNNKIKKKELEERKLKGKENFEAEENVIPFILENKDEVGFDKFGKYGFMVQNPLEVGIVNILGYDLVKAELDNEKIITSLDGESMVLNGDGKGYVNGVEVDPKQWMSDNAYLFKDKTEANIERIHKGSLTPLQISKLEQTDKNYVLNTIQDAHLSEKEMEAAYLSTVTPVENIHTGEMKTQPFITDSPYELPIAIGEDINKTSHIDIALNQASGVRDHGLLDFGEDEDEEVTKRNLTPYRNNLTNAIRDVVTQKLNALDKERGGTGKLNGIQLAEKYPDEFEMLQSEVTDEWHELTGFLTDQAELAGRSDEDDAFSTSDIYDLDGNIVNQDLFDSQLSKLQNSDTYKYLSKRITDQRRIDLVNINMTKAIENPLMFDQSVFNKDEKHEMLIEEAAEKEIELDEEYADLLVIHNTLEEKADILRKDLTAEVHWLEENSEDAVIEKIKEIQSRDFKTQEEVDDANAEIKRISDDFMDHVKEYQRLRNEVLGLNKQADELSIDFEDHFKDAEKFADYYNMLDKNYSIGAQMGASFMTGLTDLGIGLISVGDMLTDVVTQSYGTEESFLQEVANGMDEWKNATWVDPYQVRPTYEQAKVSAGDAFEWACVSIAGQGPQLVGHGIATGLQLTGAGFPAGTALQIALGASAAGNQYREFEENALLYNKTNGLYGEDIDFLTAFTASTGVGAVEYASERVTFGLATKVGKGLLSDVGQATGWKYLRQNVFNYKSMRNYWGDVSQEAISEGLASLGQNGAQILAGKKGVGLYDNVEESMVIGGLIGKTMKTPLIFKHAIAPFRSPSNDAILSSNLRKVNKLGMDLLNPDLIDQHASIKEEIARLTQQNARLIEEDIKRVDLLNNDEKRDLINIESDNRKLTQAAKEIQEDKTLTKQQKQQQLQGIIEKLNKNQVRKQEIIDKYPEVTEAYKQTMASVKKQGKLVEKYGGPKVEIEEGSTERFGEVLEEMGVDPVYQTRYGGMMPILDADGNVESYKLFINKETSLRDGMFHTGAHEFLHGVMYQTLKQDMVSQDAVGTALLKALNDQMLDANGNLKKGAGLKEGSDFNDRINAYSPQEGQGEEIVMITSEALLNKEIELKQSTKQKLKGIFRRFAQNHLGRDIRFDTDQDLLNFVIDYNVSIKKNIPSKAIMRMAAEGAKGKLIDQYQKDLVDAKNETVFSKNVIQEITNNPDIKQEFDQFVQNPDGSKKYKTKESFQQSVEFFPAYDKIVNSKVLDGLVMANVSDVVQPSQMSEFVRNVKEKIGDRFLKNFNPAVNDSLFGWLTGVAGGRGESIIYRAKGDIMNEYSKQIQAQSLEAQAEKSAQIEDKADKSLEIFEELNLETGRVKGPIGIKLSERLGPKAKEINNTVKEIASEMDLENLNFKTLKDLTPNLTQEMFGIKPKVGNLTKSDIKNAQMFINKNASTLIAMLPEGSTASGTSTGVQKVLLDAFYTKSDRAKMAETGTKAGLAVQIKNDNITPSEFLEVFGITKRGEANLYKKDSNTSSRIKALVAQTGRMMTNQGVREYLNNEGKIKLSAKIADGKARMMFSNPPSEKINNQDISSLLLATQKSWKQIVKDRKLTPIDMNTEQGRALLKEFVVNKLSKRLPEIFFKTSGTFDGSSKSMFNEQGEQVRVPKANLLNKTVDETIAMFAENHTFGPSDVDINNLLIKPTQSKTNLENAEFKASKLRGFKKVLNVLNEMIQEDKANIPYVAALLSSTSSNQGHFMRKGSLLEFINSLNEANVEEHTQAASDFGKFILNRMIEGNYNNYIDLALNAYTQGSLPKRFDNLLQDPNGEFNYKNNAGEYTYAILVEGKPVWIRYFNPNVNNNQDGINPNVLILANGNTVAQEFGVGVDISLYNDQNVINKQQDLLFKIFNGDITQSQASAEIKKYTTKIKPIARTENVKNAIVFSKAVNNARAINKNTESRGMSAFDFDETLIDKGKNVITAKKGDDVVVITSSQWPIQGPQLAKVGYEFDFSDFINVRGGVEGPLMQKFRNRIAKYGVENNYILTARPAESAPAIQAWLKQQGIDMPIENITGLGNSTGEAKAMWMANKYAEGYNDMYFVDDALPNVQAVKDIMDQLDIKGSSVQAKIQFSKTIDENFNDILEESVKVESQKVFSAAQAKLRGARGRYKGLVPASAQDFMGLIYNFLPKGKKGDKAMQFFKKALVDPFARGINELNTSRQTAANNYKALRKLFPKVRRRLNKKAGETGFTNDQAIRVYLWNKAGFEIPGLSQRDLNSLDSFVKNDPDLQAFADGLSIVSKKTEGYSKPGEYWLAENIASDLLSDGAIGDARAEFLQEWQQNVDQIFSDKNLNKIEAIYGTKFREALEDMLYRMRTGKNRPTGANRLTNAYMNWVNNSIGAIMFFNIRSAVLQTISATNYINWGDNNPLKAAAAFANQPQFWKDFAFIFNSDYLKQRRAGNRRGVNETELTEAIKGSDNKAKAAIAWLLNKGFLPTQIADSFAIASGGAAFYRNRIKKYIKEGMTQEQAENQAWLDFQETTEVAQQSARPDLISQQQANPLGRLILAFQNTPMQYGRIMNKAFRDLANRRGDTKTHISKIVYYGGLQAVVFAGLQSAIFAALADDDEEELDKKKKRILDTMLDSWLSVFGYGGRAVGAVKSTIEEYFKQEKKDWNADHTYTILRLLGFSPPIQSKLRKIYQSIQTKRFNEGVFEKRGFSLDNPLWNAIGNVIEGVTNIPLGRLSQKILNIDNAMDASNEWYKRVALLLGWNTWDLGIKDPDIVEAKEEVKKEKKKEKEKEKEEKKEATKIIKKKEKEKENKKKEEENKELQKKEKEEGKKVLCAAISKKGTRCKNEILSGQTYCTIHEKVEQNETGEKKQCSKIKSNGKRCKMKTNAKSGRCYYHD